MTPLPVARKNEEHTSHRGSMTPSWAQSRVRSAAGRLLPPVAPRDAIADGYGTGPGYTNTIPGLRPRIRTAATSKL
jgi:hypothetical protein